MNRLSPLTLPSRQSCNTAILFTALFCICLFTPYVGICAEKEKALSFDRTLLKEIQPPYSIRDYFLLLPESVFPAAYQALYAQQEQAISSIKKALQAQELDINPSRLISTAYLPELSHSQRQDMLKKDYGFSYIEGHRKNFGMAYNIKAQDKSGHSLTLSSQTDDGELTFDIVIFTRQNNSSLIALNTTLHRVFTYEGETESYTNSKLSIYRFDGTWHNVTSQVLPSITLEDLLDDPNNDFISRIPDKLNNHPPVRITFKGQTIHITLALYLYGAWDVVSRFGESLSRRARRAWFDASDHAAADLLFRNGSFARNRFTTVTAVFQQHSFGDFEHFTFLGDKGEIDFTGFSDAAFAQGGATRYPFDVSEEELAANADIPRLKGKKFRITYHRKMIANPYDGNHKQQVYYIDKIEMIEN